MIQNVIQRKLIVPIQDFPKGDSRLLAQQLDVALMGVGFKMSHGLLKYVGSIDFSSAIHVSNEIILSLKKLVGDHVKHNVYFKDFPNNVPDNNDFWFARIIELFFTGETIYGRYQHSYEEMMERHESLSFDNIPLKTVGLGKSLEIELQNLYRELASSKIPLNDEDRALLLELLPDSFVDCEVPIRENKAIINAYRLKNRQSINVDTPLDILRIMCQLSDGDVTLLTKTKFKSQKRYVRRALMNSLNEMIGKNYGKLEDISNYKERFKRLSETFHPYEFLKEYPEAIKLFDYANKGLSLSTVAHRIGVSLQDKDFRISIDLLKKQPGKMVRTIDKIARECIDEDFSYLQSVFAGNLNGVSSRVLLSLWEHLINRNSVEKRIFVNRSGKGYVMDNNIPAIPHLRINKIVQSIKDELAKRIPNLDNVYIDPSLFNRKIAVPLSEKTKSSGFNILPRGSILPLDHSKNVLRFFMYWKETYRRTDYDLSCVFYDKDFNMISQLSWTQTSGEFGCYSGDITSAPKGASEFIELNLDKVGKRVHYIVPTVNVYAGESFQEVQESFFGWMSRDRVDKGAPFEASTVQTKFELRGSGKIGLPVAFFRDGNGFSAKWLNLCMNGMPNCNMVEQNKLSTGLLAKTILEREYLDVNNLLEVYLRKCRNMEFIKSPEDIVLGSNDKYISLGNLKEILP